MMTKAAFYPGALPDQRDVWIAGAPGGRRDGAGHAPHRGGAARRPRRQARSNVDGNPAEGRRGGPRACYDPHRDVVREGDPTDGGGRARRHWYGSRPWIASSEERRECTDMGIYEPAPRALLTTGARRARDRRSSAGTRGRPVAGGPATGLKATYVSTGPSASTRSCSSSSRASSEAAPSSASRPRQRVGRHLASSRTTSASPSRTATTSSSPTRSTRSMPITKLARGVPRPEVGARGHRQSTGNPNVRGLVFREHEGAYLLGAIFGLLASGEYEGYPAVETSSAPSAPSTCRSSAAGTSASRRA